MGENGVYVFPDAAKAAASSIDPNLLLALQNGGGMNGGMGYWWIIFLWMMWQQNGGRGNFNDYVAQSGSEGRQYLAEIMNGRFDNLGNLANILNTSVESIKNNLFAIQSNIQSVASQIGMTGLEVQNAIQAGNAALSQQLCNCCCENRMAILNQTNALQSQAAANHSAATLQSAQNHAATQLQMAQIESADQLAVCQQTNTLQSQAANNTNAILSAIKDQNAMIVDQFCQVKERELQNKINTQGDIITQLRGQISNDKQTEAFNAAFNSLTDRLTRIESRQPNTVPVQYPNLVAANATPYVGGGYFPGYGAWGNGGVVL